MASEHLEAISSREQSLAFIGPRRESRDIARGSKLPPMIRSMLLPPFILKACADRSRSPGRIVGPSEIAHRNASLGISDAGRSADRVAAVFCDDSVRTRQRWCADPPVTRAPGNVSGR